MITVVCNARFESTLLALGAKIIGGKWSLNSLPDDTREMLESEGSQVEGCKYRCWGCWFSNVYWVTRDPRCSVSFNTLAKRAGGQIDLDKFVVGRAKPVTIENRKGTGRGYIVDYQDKTYPSEAALARAFGINPITFRSRRQLGHTLEESLNEPV